MSVYLELFHGRTDPEQDMDDWGFEGPAIGPLDFVHVTYQNPPRIYALDGELEMWMRMHEDMILFRGAYYGDWSVVSTPGEGGEVIHPAELTDEDTGNRAANNGDPCAKIPGSYRVGFEDENFETMHLYCFECVSGIEGLVEDCRCDPNDRDGLCICRTDCNPKFRIRKPMMIRAGERCCSCSVAVSL